jgi:hypothetical protein
MLVPIYPYMFLLDFFRYPNCLLPAVLAPLRN